MPKSQQEWETFWSRIWSAVWNILGIIAVVIVFPLFVIWVFHEITRPPAPYKSTPSPPPTATTPTTQLSSSERQSLQSAFNVLLGNEKRPCATKNKSEKSSYVGNCSLFRVRLKMYEFQVTQIFDKSGFFAYRSRLTNNCKPEGKQCYNGRWISDSTEGFHIIVYFNLTTNSAELHEATEIRLLFEAGAYPYFDPDVMRSTFVKVIGPPDQSTPTTDKWGNFGQAHIEAHVSSDRRYSISLRDTSQIKKEEKKGEDK